VADTSGSEHELARFLRARRDRIRPEEVGFPAAGRRRTPGLRREEVAVLAGVSTTWYTYLEQGRGREVSSAVLDSIARVLRLTEDERRHMHMLAHGKVITPHPLVSDVPGTELVNQLIATVRESSYPVYAANLYCDLIGWNEAAAEWYDDWGELPDYGRNLVRWLVTSPTARERIVDWPGYVSDIVARWRAMASGAHDDIYLQRLVSEFSELSKDFIDCWDAYTVQEHRSRLWDFRHPQLGMQRIRTIVVTGVEFTPSFVVFHVPERLQYSAY
jgi:transcriptional regulator with XRE-family HTH domain